MQKVQLEKVQKNQRFNWTKRKFYSKESQKGKKNVELVFKWPCIIYLKVEFNFDKLFG